MFVMDDALQLIFSKPHRTFKQKIDSIIIDGNDRKLIEILQCVDKFAREQDRDFYETASIMLGLLDYFNQ